MYKLRSLFYIVRPHGYQNGYDGLQITDEIRAKASNPKIEQPRSFRWLLPKVRSCREL